MTFEVGQIVIVPVNLIVQIDGVDNTVTTKGKKGIVIERLFANIDSVTQNDIYDYLLQFPETFDLINSSGTVEITTDRFWFTEAALTGKQELEPTLFLSTQEINISLNTSKKSIKKSLTEGQTILNKIPINDPIYRGVSENIVDIMKDNNTSVTSIKYNPNSEDSIKNINAGLEGSALVADDGDIFVSFLDVLNTQQTAVSRRSAELEKEESQSLSNEIKSSEANSKADNTFLSNLANIPGTENLLSTAEGYKPINWEKIEPDTPSEADINGEILSDSDRASSLFPLLDTKTVVNSGLI